jgi:hypothetical protein
LAVKPDEKRELRHRVRLKTDRQRIAEKDRELGMTVEDGELVRVVEAHAWEAVPEEEKGQGKFFRRAEPGGWREDLTPEQARIVEDVMAPLLDEFYLEW